MRQFLNSLFNTLPAGTLVILGLSSLAVFLGTLVAIPFILVRLPQDYFDVRVPRLWMKDHHPALRLTGLIVKNVAGVLFLLAGISMLILPGQGILTILIGISLMDFPGKRRLEARIIGQRTVFSAVNGLRSRFGKPPLALAPEES